MPRKKEPPGLVEQLKEHIRNSGQNLNQLGLAAGVNSSQLYRFMRGERTLSMDALEKLFRALNLRVVRGPEASSDEAE